MVGRLGLAPATALSSANFASSVWNRRATSAPTAVGSVFNVGSRRLRVLLPLQDRQVWFVLGDLGSDLTRGVVQADCEEAVKASPPPAVLTCFERGCHCGQRFAMPEADRAHAPSAFTPS